MKLSNFCSLFLLLFALLLAELPLKAQEAALFSIESNATTVGKGTKILLVVEDGVDTQRSRVGDSFIARVVESTYDNYTKKLIIPKGSWVTGVVTELRPAGRISKAAKLSLQLDYLTSLTGDIYPINAIVSFEKGKVNVSGQLDPQTGFKSKAVQPTKTLLSSEVGQVVSIATLGIPVAVTLLGGSAKALISRGDNVGLFKNENFHIEMKDSDLRLKN
jgi:hypothetical protein